MNISICIIEYSKTFIRLRELSSREGQRQRLPVRMLERGAGSGKLGAYRWAAVYGRPDLVEKCTLRKRGHHNRDGAGREGAGGLCTTRVLGCSRYSN
jgi:hypothetical protein